MFVYKILVAFLAVLLVSGCQSNGAIRSDLNTQQYQNEGSLSRLQTQASQLKQWLNELAPSNNITLTSCEDETASCLLKNQRQYISQLSLALLDEKATHITTSLSHDELKGSATILVRQNQEEVTLFLVSLQLTLNPELDDISIKQWDVDVRDRYSMLRADNQAKKIELDINADDTAYLRHEIMNIDLYEFDVDQFENLELLLTLKEENFNEFRFNPAPIDLSL